MRALWTMKRLADGRLELLYTDAEKADVSCGICTALTPVGLVRMWWTEQADDFDVLVDLDGRRYVKLTDSGYPFA